VASLLAAPTILLVGAAILLATVVILPVVATLAGSDPRARGSPTCPTSSPDDWRDGSAAGLGDATGCLCSFSVIPDFTACCDDSLADPLVRSPASACCWSTRLPVMAAGGCCVGLDACSFAPGLGDLCFGSFVVLGDY
jgi:hypothetical protein